MGVKDIGNNLLINKTHLRKLIVDCSNYRADNDESCNDCKYDARCEILWTMIDKLCKQQRDEAGEKTLF